MERDGKILIAVAFCLATVLVSGAELDDLQPAGIEWQAAVERICNLSLLAARPAEGRTWWDSARQALTNVLAMFDIHLRPCTEPGDRHRRPEPAAAKDFTGASNLSAPGGIIENMNRAPASDVAGHESPEADLVIAARAGDRAAFSGLYRRHAGWLLPTLWRLTGGDRHRAEDLLQDAFVQAWHKLDQLRDPAAFGGWLKRLAVNLALADRRRLRPVDADAYPEPAAAEPPWPAADMDLERAIARLPERARQVLVLFHLEGLGHKEIAAVMNIETGTSKAQLHRARNLLKEMLA